MCGVNGSRKWFVPCVAGTYGSLDLEMVTDYVEAIRGFPVLPKPEIFGLHENADITCDQNETYNMFTTILALQPRVSGGAGISREDTILQLCESSADKVAARICISLLHFAAHYSQGHAAKLQCLPLYAA